MHSRYRVRVMASTWDSMDFTWDSLFFPDGISPGIRYEICLHFFLTKLPQFLARAVLCEYLEVLTRYLQVLVTSTYSYFTTCAY